MSNVKKKGCSSAIIKIPDVETIVGCDKAAEAGKL